MIKVGRQHEDKILKKKTLYCCCILLKIIGIFSVIFILMHSIVIMYQKDTTRLFFLDVGQGDACVITHNEQTFLVDGGGNRYMDEENNMGMRVIYPFLLYKGIDNIDVAFISHMHYDHIKGVLELFDEIKIKKVAVSHVYKSIVEDEQQLQEHVLLNELIKKCKQTNTELIFVKEGDVFLGDGIKFVCHYPFSETEYEEDENKNSMVLELKTWQQQILFTGDIEADVEEAIEKKDVDIYGMDVLKVAHHGSATSSSQQFLERTHPTVGIISVGENRHGHPSQEVIARYNKLKIPVYLTMDYGMIEVSINRKHLKIKTHLRRNNDETVKRRYKK